MPGMQFGGITTLDTVGEVAGSSVGTTLTAAGSTNTKGSYTQLVASTGRDAHWLIIQGRSSLNGTSFLLDLAIGGAGSEQIIVADLLMQGPRSGITICLPVYVPGGSRLAARVQSNSASATMLCSVLLGSHSFGMMEPGGVVTCYGQNTGDSGSTSIDPGGSGHTKGSYVQITASSSRKHQGFVLIVGGDKNTGTTAADFLIDVALGAGGSEQIIVPDFYVREESGAFAYTPYATYFPIPIPEATRIAVRAQCSITDATDRLFDCQIVGVS